MRLQRRTLASALAALTTTGLFAITGSAIAAQGPADNRGMARMHELMREGNPGMARMHELMREGNPGMARMHELIVASSEHGMHSN